MIERAILDKDCRIGAGTKILNKDKLEEFDAENYHIRDGLVVIPRGAVIPAGTVI